MSPAMVARADGGAQLGDGDLLVGDELLEQDLVAGGDGLDRARSRYSSACSLQVVGDLDDVPLGAELLVLPDPGLHGDEVDDALVVALGPDGQLDDRGVALQAVLDGVERLVEVGAEAVHLVDEADAGDVVLVGLAPHRLGLGLDAGDAVEHRDRAVEDAQRALDLDGEVHVAGGVDDVDPVVVPEAGGGGRGDGDAALLLLLHPVHGGAALVHLTDLVVLAGVVEDPLGRGGLARVDVGHDADVAGALEWVPSHDVLLVSRSRGLQDSTGGRTILSRAHGAGRSGRRPCRWCSVLRDGTCERPRPTTGDYQR